MADASSTSARAPSCCRASIGRWCPCATANRVGAKEVLRTVAGVDDVSLFGTALHVRGTTGDSATLAAAVRAAFDAAGWARAQPRLRAAGSVDVEPIAPSLEDVFVLRSEVAGRAA